MEILIAIIGSSAATALITGIFSVRTTRMNTVYNDIRTRNSELEAENAELKQQLSEKETLLHEYSEKDSAELKAQISAQRQQSEANASYIGWDD